GGLSIASHGFGTQPHLLAELLKRTAKIDIVHVPYKGPGAAITDLLAGQVQLYFETAPLVLPHVQSGKLKILALAGETRLAQLPEVPTTAEAGFADLTRGFLAGILAPPPTPPPVLQTLNRAVDHPLRSPQTPAAL